MSRRVFRTRGVAFLLAGILLLVRYEGSIASSNGSVSAAQKDVAYARAQIAKYRAVPKFVAPAPPFNARKAMAGKTIVSIPVSSEIPITAILESTMASVAKKLGFRFVHWQNQGKSDQWVQGM